VDDLPTPTWAEFFAGWPIFRDAIFCALIAGAVLGYLGVYVVLRRMVFVTAAVSQAAALGVALAFYVEIHHALALPPVVGAALLAMVATLTFTISPERWRLSRESILGVTYLACGAAVVAVGDHISQEAHDIDALLFGSAVVVRPEDLALVAIAGALVLLLHLWLRRAFVLSGFDPEAARVQGIPVRFFDVLLWVTVALMVSVTTRALGALPVFAFAVLPAMAALSIASRMGAALALATAIGATCGVVGYLVAFFFALPVGASQALVTTLALVLILPAGVLVSHLRASAASG
jgi:zinc transport system permease protein